MEQGSPPSPRTRESMLGSAFAAVKNYFTPERNPRPNEGLGITPLVRNFASLTLDDSSADTTDSFKTCSSTPEKNELSFQVPHHVPDRVNNADAIEAILFKEFAENADDTIEPNLGSVSLDESHQSDWSFISDPGEMSPVAEENPAEQLQQNVNNFLTPIKEAFEGSSCSETSVSPNQTIITTLFTNSDVKISNNTNDVMDSPLTLTLNNGASTEVRQHIPMLEDSSSHSLPDNQHDNIDQHPKLDQPGIVSIVDAAENPSEELEKMVNNTPIQDAPEGSLPCEASVIHNQAIIITVSPSKSDEEISTQSKSVEFSPMVPENNEEPDQVPEQTADRVTYAGAFEAFLSHSLNEKSDKIEQEDNLKTNSVDGNHQQDCSLALPDPEVVDAKENPAGEVQENVNQFSTPIEEVLVLVNSDQMIQLKPDPEMSISENNLIDSAPMVPENNADCVQVSEQVPDIAAGIEAILSREFPENFDDKLDQEEAMETDSLDGDHQPECSAPVNESQDVSKCQENPAEQRPTDLEDFSIPVQETLEGALSSEASVNPNLTVIASSPPKSDTEISILGNQIADSSSIAAEKYEGCAQVAQLIPDNVTCAAADDDGNSRYEKTLEMDSLDGKREPECSVPLKESEDVSKCQENLAEKQQSNMDDVLTPIEDELAGSGCLEAAVNPNPMIITSSSPKSDIEISKLENQLVDSSSITPEKDEDSVQVAQLTLDNVSSAADEENSSEQIELLQKIETGSLDGKHQPECSVPLSDLEEVLKENSQENPAEQLQSKVDDVITPNEEVITSSLCPEATVNPNLAIITSSDAEISESDHNTCAEAMPSHSLVENAGDNVDQNIMTDLNHELQGFAPLSKPEEVSNGDTEEKTPEQLQSSENNFLTPIHEVFESSLCSEASLSRNQVDGLSMKSDLDISKQGNHSMDSPSNDVIVRKGKIMVESTPQPAGIARRMASNNMSDVSPIVVCLPEEPTSAVDSPYTQCFLDEAMIHSTPDTILVKSEDENAAEKPAQSASASEWNFLEQAPAMSLNAVLNETKILPSSGLNETKTLHTSVINLTEILPNSGLNETKTLHTSVINETEILPSSVLDELKILPSVINETEVSPSAALNETKTLATMVTSETEVLPSSVLNETKTLHTSVICENGSLPNSALNETKILDFGFDETRTLFKDPVMNSPAAKSNNLDHTVTLTKAVDKANMNVTRILMNDDFNNSLIATVSPFSCKNISQKAASPANGTVLFADLNDEPRENWNASIVNKSKNPGGGVLRELNDNVLDDNMGAWFSMKANSPDKMNQNLAKNNILPPIANFEVFNQAKLQQPAINRESFFINFDPCYQPKGLLDISSVNDTVGNKAAALDLMGLEMSTESNEEKMQKEIDRLRALYDEREQVAQLKLQEMQAKNDAVEKECVEASKTLVAIEESNSKMQRELQHLGKSNVKLAYASETYQKAVEILRADLSERLEMERPANPTALAAERDSYQQHLKSAEAAFVDVLTKYEKMRKSVKDLKKSAAQREKESADLRRECIRLDETLRVVETTAKTSLEELQRKAREEQEQYSLDVSRITAQLRKSELSLKHIQDSYDKTVAENEKIAALCDDIIAGKS